MVLSVKVNGCLKGRTLAGRKVILHGLSKLPGSQFVFNVRI